MPRRPVRHPFISGPAVVVALSIVLLPGPTRASDVDHTGASLYTRYCASCHGLDGSGGVGVPLSLPSFLSSVDDEYLHRTIRLGRPGRVMPSFAGLDPRQVDAIVAHLRSWPNPNAYPRFSTTPVHGNSNAGKRLYRKHCSACHGENGEGGHGTGVTFSRPRNAPILAPSLSNPGFLASASDQLIKTTLMRGREGTPMGSFLKKGLRERDINDIVAYIRGFEKPGSTPPLASPGAATPILVRESPYGFDETIDKVKTAIGAANMRLIRVQTLDQGFVPAGTEDRSRTVVYSCDFAFLYEALKVDPRVGLFLPCRITVVQVGERVQVMSINPKRLSQIFNNSELDQLCERMAQVYESILDEVAL